MTLTALMNAAVAVAERGMSAGQSPFGAAIGRTDGSLIVAAHNTVRADGDPTAHAEVNAIRAACRILGTIDLSGHVIASTCEPCPMCAAAIHWARLDAVVFGASIADAEAAGFRELSLPIADLYARAGSAVRVLQPTQVDACRDLFRRWLAGPDPRPY
ncbi:MAG: nucleoside deaminase [Planctomycetes bacterium]|nr:nucleoside deaminase [Planctomycetota bacterium]